MTEALKLCPTWGRGMARSDLALGFNPGFRRVMERSEMRPEAMAKQTFGTSYSTGPSHQIYMYLSAAKRRREASILCMCMYSGAPFFMHDLHPQHNTRGYTHVPFRRCEQTS